MVFLEKYVHRKGMHCGSTSICNVLNYYGFSLSEEECFGLGAGLDFFYVRGLKTIPSVIFHGRSFSMEKDLCNFLNVVITEKSNPSSNEAFKEIKQLQSFGEALILITDVYYLPYFNSKFHFPGHRVVLVGIDEEKSVVFIADSEREFFQEIKKEDFLKAWNEGGGSFFGGQNTYWRIRVTQKTRKIEDIIPLSLKLQAERMLEGNGGFHGLPAMRIFLKDMAQWQNSVSDITSVLRFGYEVIERRGTGGGFFRKMYSMFLKKICEHSKNLNYKWGERMEEISFLWTEVAELFKTKNVSVLSQAEKIIEEILQKEHELFSEISKWNYE